MISCRCPQCNKQLKVKDELAGKKVKCPGCGKPVTVANSSPTLGSQSEPISFGRSLLAEAGQSNATGADSVSANGAEQTLEAWKAKARPAEEPKELWDFLAPAEKPDEIGRLGPYRVLKVLGAGGMGVVFKAEDPGLQRLVALKAMLPALATSSSSKERFFREARAAAALNHAHIVTIHQVGEDRGAPFLAMEFLEGEALDSYIKRHGKLDAGEVLRVGREIAEGLAAAHEKGLIHRDIKPANVWLKGDKRHVKILDFGLARAMADEAHLTQSGAIIGTPAYMAPEQAEGLPVDHRSDMFSLGCVLYRMCSGEMAFKGASTLAILSSLANKDPLPPLSLNAELPAELSDLVMRLLAKKPEERPQSAQEVVEALQEIEAKTGTATAQPGHKTQRKAGGSTRMEAAQTQLQPSAKRRPRLPWLVGGGVLGLGILGLLWFYLLRPGDNQANREKDKAPESLPTKFTNSLGMEFVLVPKGKAWLGGGGGTPGTKEVEIVHDFYLGKYEVTQEEWEKVTGGNPSGFKAVPGYTKDNQKRFPVENASWDDAQLFLKQLNAQAKKPVWVYRLPTEAEWEYACRGGPQSDNLYSAFDYYFEKPTNQLLPEQGNFNNGFKRPRKVGSYKPNALGLYDMHGNVYEWCDDAEKVGDGASHRVYRGGGWNHDAGFCRAAYRYWEPPSRRSENLGLRLARVPVGKEGMAEPRKAVTSPLDNLDPAKIPVENRRRWQPKELVALLGDQHRNSLGSKSVLTISPDGKWLAVPSGAGASLEIYETATMLLRWDSHDFQHTGHWPSAAFLGDGQHLFVGGRLWKLAGDMPTIAAALPTELQNHQGVAAALAKPLVAAAYADGMTRLFEFREGKLRQRCAWKASEPPAVGLEVLAPQVAFGDSDGRGLVTRFGNQFKIWDLSTDPPKELAAGDAAIIAVSPRSRTLAAGAREELALWNLAENPPKKDPKWVVKARFAFHWDDDLALTPDGKQLILGQSGNTSLWSVAPRQGTPLSMVQGASGGSAVSLDGKTLFVQTLRGELRIFDARGAEWEERRRPHIEMGRPIFSPDGRQLLTQPLHGLHTTTLWDLTGPAPVERDLPDSVRSSSLLGWRANALVLLKDNCLWTWKGAGEPELLVDLAGPATNATLSLDGDSVAFVRPGNPERVTVDVWNLRSTPPARTTLETKSNANRLQLSADAQRLMVGANGSPSRLYVREGAAWKEAWTTAPTARGGAAIAPAGDRVVTIALDSNVVVWDAGTLPPRLIRQLPFADGDTADFSRDGRLVAVAGGSSPGLMVVDARTGTRLKSWSTGGGYVAFAPDGRHLAVYHRGCIWILRLNLPVAEPADTAK